MTVVWAVCLALLATAPPTGAPLASPPPPRVTAPQAESLVREISSTVEQIRGLRFKTPVVVEVIDGATARKEFEAEIDEKERVRARHLRDAWAQLGLVPADADLVKNELELTEKDVLGYYQAGTKTFHVLDHVDVSSLRSVMAHELTHALEDQHYDLRRFRKRAVNEDHAVALLSVIEGSAMVTTLAMLQRQGGIGRAQEEASRTRRERAKTVRGAPGFVQLRLMMPYTLGFSFLLRGKPWEWLFDGVRLEDIERAYAEPPHSTREVLHPEQYWGRRRQKPSQMPLADLSKQLGPDWSLVLTGSVGELGLTLLTGSKSQSRDFVALLPTDWITGGATGNAGEVYQLYVKGDQRVTVLLTRWEGLLDADQFLRTLRLPRDLHKMIVRVGANVVVLLGDFNDDKAQLVGVEAVRGLRYWAGD